MLNKLKEKLNQNKIQKEKLKLETQLNKPQYAIDDLYVGEIV